MSIMKHINLFRAIWFNEEKDERSWFAIQVATYYSFCRRSVVLYALKRLGLIFRMSFTSLDGNIELRALYDNFEQFNRSRRFSFLLPRELLRNPLQTVLCDYSCAEDDYGDVIKDSQYDIHKAIILSEHATVSDYVLFIVAYDKTCWIVDRLRVTARLGLTPP